MVYNGEQLNILPLPDLVVALEQIVGNNEMLELTALLCVSILLISSSSL